MLSDNRENLDLGWDRSKEQAKRMYSMEIVEECRSRKEAISEKRPFSDSFTLSQIKDFYRVPNVWSSNAIEGNTLTEDETAIILRDGVTVGQHTLGEMFEAIGGGKAYDFMFTLLESKAITEDDILHFHELVTFGQPELQPGKLRDVDVIISGLDESLPSYQEVPALFDGFAEWLSENESKYDPVVFASEAHARLVSIHPFRDGNGRVSRLVMNTILLQHGYLPVSIPPIFRHDYISALQSYHLGEGKLDSFIDFIAKTELQTQKDFMRLLRISFDKK